GKVIDKIFPDKGVPSVTYHAPIKYKWNDYVKPIVRPIAVLGLLGVTIYLLVTPGMKVPYYLWMLDFLIIPGYFGLRSYEKKKGVA
nr:hypothetical protein [Candidatus Aenigmarchaeota archaeon]